MVKRSIADIMKKIKKRYDNNGRLLEEIIYDDSGKIIESISYEYAPPSSPFLFPSLKDLPKEEPEEFTLNEPDKDSVTNSKEKPDTNTLPPEPPDDGFLWPTIIVCLVLVGAFFIMSLLHH